MRQQVHITDTRTELLLRQIELIFSDGLEVERQAILKLAEVITENVEARQATNLEE